MTKTASRTKFLIVPGVVSPGLRTLETGAGISTLIFALGGAYHVAVAPWQEEWMRSAITPESLALTCQASN